MPHELQPSIFTKIINREIPADIVYEDDTVIAFFTIEPINYGHTLVVPKVPFVNIFDGDPATLGHMIAVAQKIAHALVTVNLAEGVNLVMNNGEAAGQEVFHAHIHVIPRLTDDDAFHIPKKVPGDTTIMAKVAKQLATALQN